MLKTRWRKAIHHYLKLFGLGQWRVYTDLGALEEFCMASADTFYGHHIAYIRLSAQFIEFDKPQALEIAGKVSLYAPQTLDEVACHEVLHLVFHSLSNDVEGVTKDAEKSISDTARVIAKLSPSGV